MIPPRIKNVEVIKDFELKITYENGEVKYYNMEKNLQYKWYNKLKNKEYFKLVKSVKTTLEWPDGEDIDPNELYENSIVK